MSDNQIANNDGNNIVYEQAMETFRTIGNQVVQAATVFLTGYAVLFSIAMDRSSPALLAVAGIFSVTTFLLFHRWRWFDRTLLGVASDIEKDLSPSTKLAESLQSWRRESWYLNLSPLVWFGATELAAIVWAIRQ